MIKPAHQESAFQGRGARLFGGRWSSPGVAIVYTADTASLAALELLVHLKRHSRLRNYLLYACTFAARLVETIDAAKLPADWKSDPGPADLRPVGDRWVDRASSAVLRVPSVIVDSQFNYLLNPAHPEFAGITVADPTPFSLDLRLLRR